MLPRSPVAGGNGILARPGSRRLATDCCSVATPRGLSERAGVHACHYARAAGRQPHARMCVGFPRRQWDCAGARRIRLSAPVSTATSTCCMESLPNVQPPPPYLPTSGCICTQVQALKKGRFSFLDGDQFLSLRKYQGKMVQLKFQSHQSLFDNSVSIKQQHSLMFLLFSSFPLNNSLQSPEGFFFL
jgi:hypothetical protein